MYVSPTTGVLFRHVIHSSSETGSATGNDLDDYSPSGPFIVRKTSREGELVLGPEERDPRELAAARPHLRAVIPLFRLSTTGT